MKVRTTKRFLDLEKNKTREVGDEFEVTKARFDSISHLVEEVNQVEEANQAEKGKETKKKAK